MARRRYQLKQPLFGGALRPSTDYVHDVEIKRLAQAGELVDGQNTLTTEVLGDLRLGDVCRVTEVALRAAGAGERLLQFGCDRTRERAWAARTRR